MGLLSKKKRVRKKKINLLQIQETKMLKITSMLTWTVTVRPNSKVRVQKSYLLETSITGCQI
jgi:hypothetical protein